MHTFFLHLGNQKADGTNHHDGVRRLDGYDYVAELVLLEDAEELHAALDNAFRRVAVA